MKKGSMQTCVQQLGVWPLPSIAAKVAKVEYCERQVVRIAQCLNGGITMVAGI